MLLTSECKKRRPNQCRPGLEYLERRIAPALLYWVGSPTLTTWSSAGWSNTDGGGTGATIGTNDIAIFNENSTRDCEVTASTSAATITSEYDANTQKGFSHSVIVDNGVTLTVGQAQVLGADVGYWRTGNLGANQTGTVLFKQSSGSFTYYFQGGNTHVNTLEIGVGAKITVDNTYRPVAFDNANVQLDSVSDPRNGGALEVKASSTLNLATSYTNGTSIGIGHSNANQPNAQAPTLTLDASAIVADAGFTGKSSVGSNGKVVLNDGSQCVGITVSDSSSTAAMLVSGTATITQKYPGQNYGVQIDQGSLNFQTTGATLKFSAGTFKSTAYATINITATTATATIDASADTTDTLVLGGAFGGPAETSFWTLNINGPAYDLSSCHFSCTVDPTSSTCDKIVCAGAGNITLGGSSSITINCGSAPTGARTWTFLSGGTIPARAHWTTPNKPTVGNGTWSWDINPPNGPQRSISYTPPGGMVLLDAYFAWLASKMDTDQSTLLLF